MDFDDLDDAIDERIAAGDTDGLENFAFEKKELKAFERGKSLPPISKSAELWAPDSEGADRTIRLRAFVFYGPGDTVESLKAIVEGQLSKAPWMEIAVHEWPGHGNRESESFADDVEALGQDAFDAIKASLEQVKEDAEFEGAPFAFIGRSVGCQLLTVVAKKVLMSYGMAPCASVVMDRGALQIPLLSEEGQKVLDSNPDQVVKAFNYSNFDEVDKQKYAKDVRFACETRDPFYHKFDCDMMLLKGDNDAPFLELRSKKKSRFKMTTLQIKGSNQTFNMPVESTTTVSALMQTTSSIFAYRRGTTVKAFASDGKEIPGFSTVPDNMVVEGLEDFKHPRYTWPHPVCIIGGGFMGVKMAMEYHLHKNYNVVLYDRHAVAGGDAWHLSATKYSRCQTDFGAFNIWWGHQFNYTGDGTGFGTEGTEKGGRSQFTKAFLGPGSPMNGTVASGAGTGVDFHPCRAQILGAMQYALDEYKCTDIAHFETEVDALEIVGDPVGSRFYKLGVKSLKTVPDPYTTIKASIIYHFPGAYDVNRIIDYPGESEFGGQIGYGMGNGQGGLFVWDGQKYPMKGARAAILGNGAFSVENVRSCAEQGASKIYIITRRKSLPCPRIPCWFCHQAPLPTPAGFLLDIFKPMYQAAGMEDPWDFYAVKTNEKRTDVTIKQSSRFGIGDVTFLLHALGMFEYRVGTLERCSYKTMHLSTGEKLENMDHICKALGLIGDPRVDTLHKLTHRVGNMVNGDFQRIISADATGMDAKRFTTFSAGPGAAGLVKSWYYNHNHPWEMADAMNGPDWMLVPKHVLSDTQPDQTSYMTNIAYEMYAGNVIGSLTPLMGRAHGDEASYKYCLLHTMHPTEKFLEYAEADWNRYQKQIKECNPGFENAEHVPYPYNMEKVTKWFEKYSIDLKCPITTAGPNEALKKQCIEAYKKNDHDLQMELVPRLIRESKLLASAKEDEDPFTEAMASSIHELKKDLTSSEADSALDFDDAQYDSWKNCLSGERALQIEQVSCFSNQLLTHAGSWDKIVDLLGSKK